MKNELKGAPLKRLSYRVSPRFDLLLKDLLEKSGLSAERIKEIVADTSKEYRIYYINKKNGGRRTIFAPSKDLLALQRAVLPLVKAPPFSEKYAAAYESGASVKKNAARHMRGGHILHMDIKSFFPSINREIFTRTYSKYFEENDLETLWKIVSVKGGVPIGAPTSPFIANRVLFGADKKLSKLFLFKRYKYSRYADDLIFSFSKRQNPEFIKKAEAVIEGAGFRINKKKTYFMSYRREVTGVIINDEHKLSVGTSYKKALKSQIYNLLTKNQGKRDFVRGRYAYLKHIEPLYAEIVKRKYLKYDKIGFFAKTR
jgi:hypothetical protein